MTTSNPLTPAEVEQLAGLRQYREHLNAGGDRLLRELELRAGVDTDATDALSRALDRLWIVTTARTTSTLADICFSVTPREFALQVKGGLEGDEIVGVFADGLDARKVARRELTIAGARLIEAAAMTPNDARD